ncbi:hypothetical protein HPP92_000323 [Vanilla planifolia]|uniref:Kinetochore protein Nuf2 N-terminal domain-containing protein n=1 Tax=Vanilla planifolia TaxID=51239 RepID=A0A835S1W5_VANPL|nr:hypothetical protein HPP92_000323 [Vanilla planifolia]
MASTFLCPELPASQIATALSDAGIAAIRVEDLAAPTADLARTLYSSVLNYLDPLQDDLNGQLDFGALQLLDNPEHHADAIEAIDLYHRMRELLLSLSYRGFKLADILRPEPLRMIHILSAVVNFIFYREEKLNTLQLAMEKVSAYDERRRELEEKLSELQKQRMEFEVARQMEEPMVQEVEAEVSKLKQSTQEYKKQQILMKNQDKEFTEKIEVLDVKISQAEFELFKVTEENSKLLSEVVQSPEKLQTALEEKRKKLTEVKNSERMEIHSFQEKNATLEVYLKALQKLSKLADQVRATQEQVNSAKIMEKDMKALKVKLSDDAVSIMSLEAKVLDLQGKAKQAEELLRAAEKESNARHSDQIQKLNNVRLEMEQAIRFLETRERKVHDMVAKSDNLLLEAESTKEAESLKQQKLLSKLEEIVNAFHTYSHTTNNILQRFEAELVQKNGVSCMPGTGFGK